MLTTINTRGNARQQSRSVMTLYSVEESHGPSEIPASSSKEPTGRHQINEGELPSSSTNSHATSHHDSARLTRIKFDPSAKIYDQDRSGVKQHRREAIKARVKPDGSSGAQSDASQETSDKDTGQPHEISTKLAASRAAVSSLRGSELKLPSRSKDISIMPRVETGERDDRSNQSQGAMSSQGGEESTDVSSLYPKDARRKLRLGRRFSVQTDE